MRRGTITFVVAVAAALPSGNSEAKTHRHHFCGYGPHFDYSHGNMLSPYSYIYPAANWGRFFQCRTYYSPVFVYQADLN